MYFDVIVPGPWWNALTYFSDNKIAVGARVRVPIRGGVRVGFALGESAPPRDKKIQKVMEIIDASCVLGSELWTLSRRLGSSFLCGRGEVLKVMSPPALLKGEIIPLRIPGEAALSINADTRVFSESHCYLPSDCNRREFYISKLHSMEPDGTALVLFPERAEAESFFEVLPNDLKESAILWAGAEIRGKRLWDNWLAARGGKLRIVAGSVAAAYVPLPNLSLVIVEEEANPAYVPLRHPRIPMRSAVGQRALIARAELLLGGRMPGAKTYFRKKIPCTVKPDKSLLRFVDIKKRFEAAVDGVEGSLPLSKTLVSATQKCISEGKNVLWVFDRKGYAVDIVCDSCGNGLLCEKCGAFLVASDEASVRCSRCGYAARMPDMCPSCRSGLFIGKRPGVEALEPIAKGFSSSGRGKVTVGTRKILAQCDKKNIGLVGWIDADAESRKPGYDSRFKTFSMIWESYWRGRTDDRQVIVQSRNPAMHESLRFGWESFWNRELKERKELGFPPCELLVRIDEDENVIKILEDAGYPVMQPGEGIWTSGALSELEKTLAPRFSINRSRLGFPCVTILVE